MMSCHTAGCRIFSYFCTFQSPSGGMVHLWSAMQALLKSLRILSDIMGASQKATSFGFSKSFGKAAAQLCRSLQMLLHRLFSAIRGDVGQISLLHCGISPLFLYRCVSQVNIAFKQTSKYTTILLYHVLFVCTIIFHKKKLRYQNSLAPPSWEVLG